MSLALRQVLRFTPRAARALVEVVSLRRPEVIVRSTRYSGLVVDERVLVRSFPWTAHRSSVQALVLLDGALVLAPRDGAPTQRLVAGESVFLAPTEVAHLRYEDAHCLDLEWEPAEPIEPCARRLAPVDVDRATLLAAGLVSGDSAERAVFDEAFGLFRRAGAPLGALSAERLVGEPSKQDRRIAEAIAAQLADLRTAASAPSFGEQAGLSPRQLQRVLADFCTRYRMNATNWRDMRNRYRVQLALFLLSIPSLSVAAVASEVGYTSPTALARALANAGMPPPLRLRGELARMGGLPSQP